ncbi:MAG: signal peptidase II [Deltaproteobacteria bacterium]|jgi:signal peptidase II|nr:signal peptidase II [Deltaproteobacteria bacterium]MBW2468178.1 signal peptidase II [Deltaproteobacteria bacterium]MBW2515978.1 signal peptidase II [Deltaproteobacteria bacterium]
MLKNKYARLAVIAGAIILLDQVSKEIVLRSIPLNTTIPVVDGFFSLSHIHNPGGAFGLMANFSPVVRSIIFLFISSLAVGLIFYFYKKTPAHYAWLSAAFAMIFGGAIGNLIDRIRFGIVVDFLDFYLGNLHWPAFNVADSAISIGIGIFLYHLVFKKMPD